jgi:3-dehydroquinate synthase
MKILYPGQENVLQNYLLHKQVFLLVDSKTNGFCTGPAWQLLPALKDARIITMPSGEAYKNKETLDWIYTQLQEQGTQKDAVLVCLGGGVVSDMGGFAAATYMRGIEVIFIPTTLLAMTDAAIGGKTGYNFQHAKNNIGLIYFPTHLYINPIFLDSLNEAIIKQGFVESIKHYLIADAIAWQKCIAQESFHYDLALIKKSIAIKESFVQHDVQDGGIRQALNFGHSIGHALEAQHLANNKALSHGQAVLLGMLVELGISEALFNLDKQIKKDVIAFNKKVLQLQLPTIDAKDILPYLAFDKKNKEGVYKFSLIKSLATPALQVSVSPIQIEEAINQLKDEY